MAMFLNIVQSNLHSIYNSALTVIFTTPVLQKQEKKHFSQEIGGLLQRSLRVVNFGFRLRFSV